ncbi:hypothetical protein M513_06302 [Trichuris suis]|uniref:Uncharacterized protein n=1 Tax=Trichuris suis TaxID=68888 RepID=A0A085M6G5_9BILA|nr:hypothetical protein M513_06302 [Trichuris suis]
MPDEDYVHLRVNHPLNIVHSVTDTDMPLIEPLWARAKPENRVRCSSTHKSMMNSYFCEFIRKAVTR